MATKFNIDKAYRYSTVRFEVGGEKQKAVA